VELGGIFIWLSGASRKVLAECPTERPKYFGLGAIILVTGAMAGVSLAFALVNALKITLSGAIIFAILWGLAIMMIDRMFVVSMHRQRNPLIYFIQAVPRLLMSIVLGFVISTPFVLQIFKPEITNQVQQMQAAQREAYFKGLPTNPVYRAVQGDQATVNRLKAQEASGGTPVVVSNDPQIQAWTKDQANASTEVQHWTDEQNCQLYGGKNNGVTCHPGYGPVAHNDQAEITYWSGQATTYSQDIASRTALLESQDGAKQSAAEKAATAQLPAAEGTLQAATVQLNAQTKNITSGINGNDGILEQLKALGAVTAHNFTLQMARLLLFLLFLFVDIMPVFVKLLMNLTPAGLYDKVLAGEEQMQLQLAENTQAVRQLTRRQAVQAEATGVRYRNSALSARLPGMHDKILSSRYRVEEEWLRRREAEQMRDLAYSQGIADVGPVREQPDWSQGQANGSHAKRPGDGDESWAGPLGPQNSLVPLADVTASAWASSPPPGSPTQPSPLWYPTHPNTNRESRWARLLSFRPSLLRRLPRWGRGAARREPFPQPGPHPSEQAGWAATAPSPEFGAPPAEPADGPAASDFFPTQAGPGAPRNTVPMPDFSYVELDEARTEALPGFGSVPTRDLPGDDETG
jgi:Domain of unknown function (DUF4407)